MPLDWQRIEVLDDAMIALYRARTPAERLSMGNECNLSARRLIAAQLSSTRPDWTKEQVAREVARRMLGGSG
ncbi:MAG: hypothetical protein K8U03_10850 [Planctomycetia bacterium]|nr:hypothetical protein [Planctomycetia bacterium]